MGAAAPCARPPFSSVSAALQDALREGVIQLQQQTGSQFQGPNLGYVLELYERFKEDPNSVDEETRDFFERWSPPSPSSGSGPSQRTASQPL